MPIVAYLTNANADPQRLIDFKQALADLGLVDGDALKIEIHRAVTNSHYDELASRLADRNVDVIIGVNGAATQAAKRATETIPIVMTAVNDPIAWGFVKSLEEPGTNVTGTTLNAPHLWRERLRILHGIVPRLQRVAVLFNGSNKANWPQFERLSAEGREIGFSFESMDVRLPEDIAPAFEQLRAAGAEALLHTNDSFINSQRHVIASLAADARVPALYVDREYVAAGGLMSFGAGHKQGDIEAAKFVASILKKADPATLAVKVPDSFVLSMGTSALHQLGLSLPPKFHARVDEWLP